eukprot:g25682.t1
MSLAGDCDGVLKALEKEPFTQEVAERLMKHEVLRDLRAGVLPKESAELLLKTLLHEQYFVCNSDLRTFGT